MRSGGSHGLKSRGISRRPRAAGSCVDQQRLKAVPLALDPGRRQNNQRAPALPDGALGFLDNRRARFKAGCVQANCQSCRL